MGKDTQDKCKRKELQCKLNDLVLNLERSLQPEQRSYQESNMSEGNKAAFNKSQNTARKKPECCCPPGCCKESLEYKPPDLSKLMGNKSPSFKDQSTDTSNSVSSNDHTMGHLPWHKENHSNGCFPGHDHGQGGGQSSTPRGQGQGGTSSQHPLDMTPEELQQRGCFIARAAQ